jgi:hypothetical protein
LATAYAKSLWEPYPKDSKVKAGLNIGLMAQLFYATGAFLNLGRYSWKPRKLIQKSCSQGKQYEARRNPTVCEEKSGPKTSRPDLILVRQTAMMFPL